MKWFNNLWNKFMTSMCSSKEEYRYNILNMKCIASEKEMKDLFFACPSGSFAYDCAVEVHNALCVARAEAKEALKKDPSRFINFRS